MEIGRHLREDEFDRFSMGTLLGDELAAAEEHLLLCEECRKRVAMADEWVAAMRRAAGQLCEETVPAPAARWRFGAAWGLALASVMAVAFVVIRHPDILDPTAPVLVPLRAMRGSLPGAPPGAHAKSGERLALAPDLTGLPEFPSYRLEVVDVVGRQIASAEWKQSPVTTPPLAPGMYFVRLYSPSGVLLREYGLETGRR